MLVSVTCLLGASSPHRTITSGVHLSGVNEFEFVEALLAPNAQNIVYFEAQRGFYDVDTSSWYFPVEIFKNMTSLRTLILAGNIPISSYNFSMNTALEHVDFTSYASNPLPLDSPTLFWNARSTLKSLAFRYSQTPSLEPLKNFTALESVHLTGRTSFLAVWSRFAIPPTLRHLSIDTLPISASLEIKKETEAPLQLETVTLRFEAQTYGTYTIYVESLPDSVRSINISGIPTWSNTISWKDSMTTAPSALEEIHLSGVRISSGIPSALWRCFNLKQVHMRLSHTSVSKLFGTLPDWRMASIRNFSVENFGWTSATMDTQFCSNLDLNSIESIQFYGYDIPRCLKDQNSIKTIYVERVIFPNSTIVPTQLESLTVNLPKAPYGITPTSPSQLTRDATWWTNMLQSVSSGSPNLTSLSIINAGAIWKMALPAFTLMEFKNLKTLRLSNAALTGTIPKHFFKALSKLEVFDATMNNIAGEFPAYGLTSLKEIRMALNKMNHWPTSHELVNLEVVNFASNQLYTLPDTEAWTT